MISTVDQNKEKTEWVVADLVVKQSFFNKMTFEQTSEGAEKWAIGVSLRKRFQEEQQVQIHKKLEHTQHFLDKAIRPVRLKGHDMKGEEQMK